MLRLCPSSGQPALFFYSVFFFWPAIFRSAVRCAALTRPSEWDKVLYYRVYSGRRSCILPRLPRMP